MARLASTLDNDDVPMAKIPRFASSWTPSSWRGLPVKQQPYYEDRDELEAVMTKLNALPPLVQVNEVDELKRQLAEVAAGKRFILQGGDCAERFEDCTASRIQQKLKILMQMGLVLGWGARIPLTKIGRIAGQYHKPRSKPTEMIGDREVYAYKGDAINGIKLDDREHDPRRLEQGYYHSCATLNYMRGLLRTEFADVRSPRSWDLDFVKNPSQRAMVESTVEEIAGALDFAGAYSGPHGKAMASKAAANTAELFTAHEGLVLEYEEAMTRPHRGKYYNLGAHFVWIGDRTRQLDGAHIEYFRGIQNPVGVKCGPTTVPAELVEIIKAINPQNELGKIVLIHRFGAKKVKDSLRRLIHSVQGAGLHVVWQCDPMHGNTFSTAEGVKTRAYSDILSEVVDSFEVHAACGSWLGGVHFELSGEDVTECVGGSCGLTPEGLSANYESFCDPRLNWQQSIEMAFSLVDTLRRVNKK